MERLSRAEIEDRYRDEWVLIIDPEVDEMEDVLSGVVVAHDKNRDEIHRAARQLDKAAINGAALFYIGEPEPGLIFVL